MTNTPKFYIEKNVAIPNTRTAKNPMSDDIDAQLKAMQVGDSFFISFQNESPDDKTYSPLSRTILHRAKRLREATSNAYTFTHRLMQYSISGKVQWGIRTFRIEAGSLVKGLPKTRKPKATQGITATPEDRGVADVEGEPGSPALDESARLG